MSEDMAVADAINIAMPAIVFLGKITKSPV
jgi:hypothetical protein